MMNGNTALGDDPGLHQQARIAPERRTMNMEVYVALTVIWWAATVITTGAFFVASVMK